MGRPKRSKNKPDEEIEENNIHSSSEVNESEAEYNQLINEIKPKLLTKAQLKQGGAGIRSRYEKEKGFEVLMPEINELGKKLGKPRIGLGSLRQ